MNASLKKLHKELDKHGVLLLTDPVLPSLVTTLAGGPIKGSWWGHPQGNLMYNLANDLLDDPNIIACKFINKKVTYFKKTHWDALYTIATSQSEWQTKKLPPTCLNLWKKIETQGRLRADDPSLKKSAADIGKLVAKLEDRLLVFSTNVHTDAGKHVRVMQTWKEFFKTKKYKIKKVKYDEALIHFENLRLELLETYETPVKMPWS